LYGYDEVDAPFRFPHISNFSYWKEEVQIPFIHGSIPIQIPFILYIFLRVRCQKYIEMYAY
jgi:hypothetical protein